MRYRNYSIALASAVVASGAWYAYRDKPSTSSTDGVVHRNTIPQSNTQDPSTALSAASLHTAASQTLSAETGAGGEESTVATRRALVVDNDQFYTGTIDGDGPLWKATDDAGRKVLEMMTPEQATQKLRRNEESYLVSRGRGVVRYDVVQIPSNDPIEDDHAEKIVEVPQSVVPTRDGSVMSDWLFWGVYDGHRYSNTYFTT